MTKYIDEKNRCSLTKYGLFCLYKIFYGFQNIYNIIWDDLNCSNQVKLVFIHITVYLYLFLLTEEMSVLCKPNLY